MIKDDDQYLGAVIDSRNDNVDEEERKRRGYWPPASFRRVVQFSETKFASVRTIKNKLAITLNQISRVQSLQCPALLLTCILDSDFLSIPFARKALGNITVNANAAKLVDQDKI